MATMAYRHIGTHGDYELRQLVGRTRDRGTGHITKRPQSVDEVLRNGVRIGFCGRHTGAPFTPLKRLDPGETEDAMKAIAAIRFQEGLFGPPGRASQAPDSAATDAAIADLVSRQHGDDEADTDDEDTDGDDDQFDDELASEL